jgi:hypothetical protein
VVSSSGASSGLGAGLASAAAAGAAAAAASAVGGADKSGISGQPLMQVSAAATATNNAVAGYCPLVRITLGSQVISGH